MIQFNCIIHKETGTVIKYEGWIERVKSGGKLGFFDVKTGEWNFEPKEMLFSDDFEIIYNSEFTVDELFELNNVNLNVDLRYKVTKLRFNKIKLKDKYGIDI